MECMQYIERSIEKKIDKLLKSGKSILLLGPRQTGKTTLLRSQKSDLHLNLIQPDVRQRYEQQPGLLLGEIDALRAERKKKLPPLIVLDEIQRVPALIDVVQDAIDRHIARFVLLGSSARKLRRHADMNLLPGRVILLRLDPLSLRERKPSNLEEALLYGSLPGIVSETSREQRDDALASYVTAYLEEEVRAEALVRSLGDFGRFLELAAAESGKLVSMRRLSQDIGVAHTTIQAYYQILEDCLIAERIEPLTRNDTRRKLTKSAKYLFFDLGVRRVTAREGTKPQRDAWGPLLEQYIGLELLRASRGIYRDTRLHFWRDADGPEVDWVIARENRLIPIEVKWSDKPTIGDVRHMRTFMREYPNAKKGFVICRAPRTFKIDPMITALPWERLHEVFL